MKTIHKAYVAGFIDGEGTIGCNVNDTKGDPKPFLRVAVSNFDVRPLEKMRERWGGSLSKQKTDVWGLHLNGKAALRLLKDILPWIMIKREACEAAIEMYKDFDNYPHRLYWAMQVMEATRRGYKAERSSKMYDRVRKKYMELMDETTTD